MRLSGLFSDPKSVDFIEKVMAGAGFAPSTRLALSPGILRMRSPTSPPSADSAEKDREEEEQQQQPPRDFNPTPPNHDDAVSESEEIIFSIVDELLLKTGIRAEEIDVVVTTCSCFAPVPSLAASVVNRFGMRADVLTASLVSFVFVVFGFFQGSLGLEKRGKRRKNSPKKFKFQAGAGCGGNVVAIDLASRVLRSLPRSTKGRFAVVVCTENITNNWSVAAFYFFFNFLFLDLDLDRGGLNVEKNSPKTFNFSTQVHRQRQVHAPLQRHLPRRRGRVPLDHGRGRRQRESERQQIPLGRGGEDAFGERRRRIPLHGPGL